MNCGVVREIEVGGVDDDVGAPCRQMKLRPKASGCSVRTKAPARQSGTPAATRRSQVSLGNSETGVTDGAPSISQPVSF